MASAQDIGKSLIFAVALVVILSALWPLFPTSGPFSSISWQLRAVLILVAALIVVGPGQVAYDIITDSDW
jgi:uncharacterized membrane protein YjjB (DUF3815 family)